LKEKMERESRATYRSGIDGHYSREISGGVTPTSSVSREKRGNGGGDDADMQVPPGRDRERGGRIPFRGRGVAGPVLKLGPGQIGSPGPFIFLFLLFSFSISVFFISSYPFQI
jgi:hypothetical protein